MCVYAYRYVYIGRGTNEIIQRYVPHYTVNGSHLLFNKLKYKFEICLLIMTHSAILLCIQSTF